MSKIVPLPATAAEAMSSLDLLDIINAARAQFGEPTLRNNKFIEKIESELDGELDGCPKSATVPAGGGTAMDTYLLTHDQCMLVSMRESKGVRRTVLAKLKSKQQAVPTNFAEALRLAADEHERRQIAEAQRDEAVRTKALIGTKREATAMATASAKSREVEKLKEELGRNREFATLIAVENATKREFPKNAYVELRREAKANGVPPVEVPDKRYGKVKAWPAIAWKKVFGIELPAIFPAPMGGAH